MWVASGLGKTPLRYLLVTPFMYAGELKGVIELGTAHEFSGLYLNFLDQVRESLAMTFHSVQTRAKMRVPLETIRQQTEELQQQREQLRVRYAELEAQTRTLRESEYELRQQQEQFQARRAELEAQARTLQEFEQKLRQQQEQLQANQEELVSRAWTLRESKQEFRQEQEQFRASREELAAQHRALQESERELQQQQEQFRANQEDSESRSRALQESERTFQQQQAQLQARQAELETQSRALREFEQKLQQQREKLQQKDEELSRRARDLEKYREVMKGRVLALERAQRLVKEKIQDLNLSGKYKPEFLANMSYKLRTSLNRLLILSNLPLENKDRNLTAKQVEFARTINASVTKLLALINEVLHLSKVELGTIELHVEDLSLKGLVSSIEQHFAPVAAEKGLYLVVNLADGLPATIRTDRQQVEQIVKQFLSNAFKFTEQGSVSVRITRPAPGVELSPKGLTLQNAIAIAVTDTGIGVPQDKQRVIFEAFQQANGTTSRKYGGTGLGLAIARGLAKLLGGEIQVHSEEGRGSTFTLYLPEKLPIAQAALLPDVLGETAMAFTAEEEVASVDPTSVSARPISHQEEQDAVRTIAEAMTTTVKNVLIVENDGLTLMSMVELLSGSGVEITTAETGQDAYRQLQTTRFDCMILDINLTDLSAFELLDMIEEDPLIAPLPIIVYTDRELTPEENRGLQQYTKGPLITDVNSPEQILDEMTGLLLQAGPGLPTEQQQQLRIFQGRDPVLDKKTILVVDDVPSTDSLTNVLQEKGLQVLLAENEAAALQQLNAHPEIDLVLMDLMQPEMNGYDVTRKIRKDTRFMKLPVIALTGKALDGDRQKCLEAGANDYLSKPVDTDELLSLLRVWLY